MNLNYLIYLSTLSKEEKFNQICIILIFFLVLLALCGILKFVKSNFMDETKNSLFQRFLKKL